MWHKSQSISQMEVLHFQEDTKKKNFGNIFRLQILKALTGTKSVAKQWTLILSFLVNYVYN